MRLRPSEPRLPSTCSRTEGFTRRLLPTLPEGKLMQKSSGFLRSNGNWRTL